MGRVRRIASLVVVLVACALPSSVGAASLNPVQRLGGVPYGGVVVSPDGDHAYATGNGFMYVFDRDAASGVLTLQESHFFAELGGGLGVVGLAVSSDGEHIYALSPGDELLAFDRNPTTGAVSFVGLYDDLADSPGLARQPTGLALDAGGDSVYVVANDPLGDQDCGAIGVFARNAGDGTLTSVETEVLPVAACPGGGAVTVSPDGGNVYVTGDNAVQVYARSSADGSLTAQQTTSPTVLRAAESGIVVAPDGAHVYVATNDSGATECNPTCISDAYDAFGRDFAGSLTALGSTDQTRLSEVAVNGGGTLVLFATAVNGRVFLYDRVLPGGALTLSDTFTADDRGPAAVPKTLTLSPDDRHAYVVIANEVVVLQLTCGDGIVDPGEGCDDGDADASDGCSQHCQIESCWSCTGEPSSCSTVSDGTACDDDSACTLADVCSAGVCAGAAEPDPTCRIALRNKTTMKSARTSKFAWKWTRGQSVLEDFGDPVTTTDYTLCIYDDSVRPQPIVELVPARFCEGDGESCWRSNGADGFEYENASRYPFRSISLRPGVGSRARVHVDAATLGEPSDALPTLPLVTPVTVQLKSSEGECWQSVHSAAKASSDTKFTAR